MPVLTEECEEIVREGRWSGRQGELRIFRQGWLDALFRSPPWLPFVWGAPLIGALLEYGEGGALHFAGGWALWWGLELLMHRFFFHLPGEGRVARGVRFLVHGHHHAFPRDRGRLVATPWQAALALLVLFGVARAATDGWPTVLAGSTTAYLVYEAVHWRIHHEPGGGRWIRRLRAHHLRHHAEPARRFGISLPV